MNNQQLKTQCNSDKLELFLRGSLSSSETEILELHLTECGSCARQIQLNAEQAVSWNQAQSLLAPDEYDSPQHIAAISALLSDEHDPMTKHQTADVLSREIRGWLDPTDDPHSMGRFAGYEIVGIVGHGGMGIVLKGFEASLNRYVAIKILAPRLATNGSARKRFAREAQAAAAVRHDNVIAIHRVDEWHGLPFLVMPYAGGISLQKRIDCDGPLSIEQTLRVGVQIASGLAAAHAQGLIHRDIKPANILLEQGVERVTITDFGLARAADDASVTRTGVIAGTPQYMSPEQAEAKQLDARSDLFSLGSVLYAMATGRPPFRGVGSFEVLKRIVNESPRPMREIQVSVPEWFENIVNRLHSRSPGDRPSSASDVADLLENCLAHVRQPTTTALPKSLTATTTAANRNDRGTIARFLAAAVFAFSLIFAGVLIVLELNKGTLTIECEVDDVPIRIMQGDKVVEKLTISTAGKSVRVAADNYEIEIDGSFDNVVVNGGKVALKRGQTEVVRISHSPAEARKEFSASLEKIANLPDDTEIHVVGCYLATNNQPVVVRVERTGKPIVVVLNAYMATSWNLDIDKEADVRGVILSGYFDQRFSHMVPKETPTLILPYFPIWKGISGAEKQERVSRCFYVWSPLLEDFGKMESLIRYITERDVTTFQGIYSAKSFVIDGQRGAREAQVAARWQNLSNRSNRGARGYRLTLAEMELVRDDDESGLNAEQIQRLNQLMDAYENELTQNGTALADPGVPTESRTWQQTDPYVAPNFVNFFPDSKDGGLELDALWNAADKDSCADAEILHTVRNGFRNTGEHRMLILRWIGNKYIRNKTPQNPDAIEIMYHAADYIGEYANPSGARQAAVYFGLSVTQPKTPAILRTLAELSMRVDDPNDLDRIAWGCSDQKAELLDYLKPFLESDDEAVRNRADVSRRIFTRELNAFTWAAEQQRHRAEKKISSQLRTSRDPAATLLADSIDGRIEAREVPPTLAGRKSLPDGAVMIESDPAHTISGFVMEFRSGTPDVPVCLCDAATGLPVAKDTYKPIAWSKGPSGNPAKEMAIVVSDAKGNFRFENVPDGKYRLIAQKWMGPYKGVFELHGAEIRLLGAVDEITVPRPADEQEARVVPTPLGENTIQFNQDVPNNGTFLFLSTAPPEFDAILGLQSLETSFWKNLIGVNRMPLGKTTVIGTPDKPVYAFLFAPDNSPGYATITIPPPESGMVRLSAEPFVAGWSNGRKTPPPKLAELIEFMMKRQLTTQQLLNIPEMNNASFKAYQARMQELTSDLSRTIELPDGESARIGDLLAADAYRKLQK